MKIEHGKTNKSLLTNETSEIHMRKTFLWFQIALKPVSRNRSRSIFLPQFHSLGQLLQIKKMNNDQEFNIALVAAVEQYEELYNYNVEKYSNRQSQEKAWKNVADQVKSTATECKKRWRMLRVTFLRCLRERKKPSGSSGKKKKPHYLEDAMKFLIPFTKSRCETGNVESDDERAETESYSQVSDSEIFTNENDDMHNSDDTQYTQDDQNESTDTTIQETQAQRSEANELETQLPSKSTNANTRSFQVPPLTKRNLKTKQPSTGSWEHAAVQCLSDLSTKYKRKMDEPPHEEDSDLLFLKSLLPDMKKLDDAQKRRYKQRILVLYDDIINEKYVPIPASSVSSNYNEAYAYRNEQYVPIPVCSPAISNYSSASSVPSNRNEGNTCQNVQYVPMPVCSPAMSNYSSASTVSSNRNEANYQASSSYASLVSAAIANNFE